MKMKKKESESKPVGIRALLFLLFIAAIVIFIVFLSSSYYFYSNKGFCTATQDSGLSKWLIQNSMHASTGGLWGYTNFDPTKSANIWGKKK